MSSNGMLYISGETGSSNFDVTSGAYDTSLDASGVGVAEDSFLVLIDTADSFIRGDVDLDGTVDWPDLDLLRDSVSNNVTPSCADTADVNDDGQVDGVDVTHLLAYLSGTPGSDPKPPYPACGQDPNKDKLPLCIGNGQVCP